MEIDCGPSVAGAVLIAVLTKCFRRKFVLADGSGVGF